MKQWCDASILCPKKPTQNPENVPQAKLGSGGVDITIGSTQLRLTDIRYNTLNMNLTDMNKINIIQAVPKRACKHSGDTCSYCKYEALHPLPIPSDCASKDWDGEKAKAREQRSLIDFDPPRWDLRQMTNSEIVNDLPIHNLAIWEDKIGEELPVVPNTLVLPPEAKGKDITGRGREVCHLHWWTEQRRREWYRDRWISIFLLIKTMLEFRQRKIHVTTLK